jgi:hypothetical protein
MKRFKAIDFTLNPDVKRQIEREASILKQIEHENLVKFFELLVVKSEDHFEQHFFILTEYYEVRIIYLINNKQFYIISSIGDNLKRENL